MLPIESSDNTTTPITRRRCIRIILLIHWSPHRWYHIILRSLRILYQATHQSKPSSNIAGGTCYKHRWSCIEVYHNRPAISGSCRLYVGTSTLSLQTCLENEIVHWGCFGDWIGQPSMAVDSRTEGRSKSEGWYTPKQRTKSKWIVEPYPRKLEKAVKPPNADITS